MLNFAEQTGSGALIMIWPFPVKYMQTQYTKQSKAGQSKANNTQIRYNPPSDTEGTAPWIPLRFPTVVLTLPGNVEPW